MANLKKKPLAKPGTARPGRGRGGAPAAAPPAGPPAPAFMPKPPASATAPAPAPPAPGPAPPPPKPPGGVVNDNWLATHQDAAKALTDLINSKNAGPGGKPMAVPTSLGPTPGGTPAPTPPPPPAAAPPPPVPLTRDQVIANQLGTDPGTGTAIRDTSNPNDPMYAAAQRAMQDQLAQIRSRYGASGFGNSGREALAEGNATGAFGGQIAGIGEQAYQNDAQRRLAAALGAQNLNLGAQALQVQGQNAMAQLGQALNAIGAGEQSPQNLQALLSMLGLTMGQTGTGNYGSTDVGGGYGQWGSGTNV